MDIEHLSKSQIILLTLLVSFVTSIATGIVTVSLMDQAPPAIAQTVNRVIERTVEKIVPTGQAASSVVTQEKTVVVKESDLVAQAVAKASVSVVRLFASGSDDARFLGLGVVLDEGGMVVTDAGALGDSADAFLSAGDGGRVRAFVKSRDRENGLAFLQAATSSDEGGAEKAVWRAVTVLGTRPVLGEAVVTLGGKTVARIGDGIVTALIPRSSGPDVIDTDIPDDASVMGSPLIDTDGNLAGISTEVSRASSSSGFISSLVLVRPSAKNTE